MCHDAIYMWEGRPEICHVGPHCMSTSLLDNEAAARPGMTAAAHTVTSPQQGCMCRPSQLRACMQAGCGLFWIRPAPCLFCYTALAGHALPLQGQWRCGTTCCTMRAFSSCQLLSALGYGWCKALWLHVALLHCFVPAPCFCCRRGPSWHCSATCFTTAACDFLIHCTSLSQGALKAGPLCL